jgi:hypothetical protein
MSNLPTASNQPAAFKPLMPYPVIRQGFWPTHFSCSRANIYPRFEVAYVLCNSLEPFLLMEILELLLRAGKHRGYSGDSQAEVSSLQNQGLPMVLYDFEPIHLPQPEKALTVDVFQLRVSFMKVTTGIVTLPWMFERIEVRQQLG